MSGQDRLESIRPAVAGLAGTSTVQDNSGDEQSAHVKLDDVGHSFDGDDWLFRHITMTLYPRRVYALVGPSGSGKSTLLSIVAGWQQPAQGKVIRVSCGRVCWVLQNPHGVARRKVIDHVALPYILAGNAGTKPKSTLCHCYACSGLTILPPNSSVTCPVARLSG